MQEKIKKQLEESILIKKLFVENKNNLDLVKNIVQKIVGCYKNNRKLIVFGNGGSAADAQHFVAELVGRFKRDRCALNAVALSTNTSIITSLGNDYSFDIVFSRQIEAIAQKGDIVFGISTSGNSKNVLKAIDTAKQVGCLTVGLTGKNGGKLKDMVDYCICSPVEDTPRIQELHITIIHIICDLVEEFFVN